MIPCPPTLSVSRRYIPRPAAQQRDAITDAIPHPRQLLDDERLFELHIENVRCRDARVEMNSASIVVPPD
jgi:hypothetical protein